MELGISNKRENGHLTILLSGRLDASSFDMAKKNIEEWIKPEDERLTFDLSGLSYISSAGLRLFVQLQKRHSDMRVIGVLPEVMDIFRITGMLSLLDVESVMQEISIDGMPLIGTGASSEVYRMDDEHVLKLYLPEIDIELIRQEKAYARTAFINGINTAVSYDIVKCGSRFGTIFELVDAKTLASAMDEQPERLKEYSIEEAKLLYDIHHTELGDGTMPRTSDHYHEMADQMTEYLEEKEISLLHRLIDSIPERQTFVHGDFHPRNIVAAKDGLMLIDMADATIGNPIYDMAASYISFVRIPEEMKEGAREMMGLDPGLLPKSWDILLKEYYKDKDNEWIDRANALIGRLSGLKRTLIVPKMTMFPEEVRNGLISSARKELLPHIDEIIREYEALFQE